MQLEIDHDRVSGPKTRADQVFPLDDDGAAINRIIVGITGQDTVDLWIIIKACDIFQQSEASPLIFSRKIILCSL